VTAGAESVGQSFALLASLAPDAVHRGHLGIYIDAFEWVELPNTLGVSQLPTEACSDLAAAAPVAGSGARLCPQPGGKGCLHDLLVGQ